MGPSALAWLDLLTSTLRAKQRLYLPGLSALGHIKFVSAIFAVLCDLGVEEDWRRRTQFFAISRRYWGWLWDLSSLPGLGLVTSCRCLGGKTKVRPVWLPSD
jgi:hypothetical protein